MHSLTLYKQSIKSKAFSLSPISKITVDINRPDVDKQICLYTIAWFPNALTVNSPPTCFHG